MFTDLIQPMYLSRIPSFPKMKPIPFSVNLIAYRLPAT